MLKKHGILLLAAVFVMVSAFAAHAGDLTPEQLVADAKAKTEKVSVHELKSMMDRGEDIIILDVRDKEEFEKEHIKGAINISRGTLEFLVQNKIPDKNARIIVY